MGGGLMQLVAYGAQDIYLTGNPQITFFKVVYRRHTNFSIESIQQSFAGDADFGGTVVATISRNGDLVHRMYLEHSATFSTGDHFFNGVRNIGLCERYGHSLIKESEIEIGGQIIDKHTSIWNRVYSDLTELNSTGYYGGDETADGNQSTGITGNGTLFQLMTGNGYGINTEPNGNHYFDSNQGVNPGDSKDINGFTYKNGNGSQVGGTPERTPMTITVNKIFLPLYFWFCRNPGLALPLIALQYHEVKVKLNFVNGINILRNVSAAAYEGVQDTPSGQDHQYPSKDFKLWCDYIYLDTDERRRFAQVSHEYLIEQLQIINTIIDTPDVNIKLNFNHPVKELIWCGKNIGNYGRCGNQHSANMNSKSGKDIHDPTAGPATIDTIAGEWKLKLNGRDRFESRDYRYFTRTQVWQHHTGYGGTPTEGSKEDGGEVDNVIANGYQHSKTYGNDSISVYSFSLKPEEHQPSGTCNFSRIDSAILEGKNLKTQDYLDTTDDIKPIEGTNYKLDFTIFAVNYNVLRIMSGMGGLAYSN
jgi:hypothetical protein